MIERTRDRAAKSPVSVWGIGGSGGHAVAALIAAGVASFDMIVADGDARTLAAAPDSARVLLAPLMCQGPETGLPAMFADAATRRAAEAIAARLDDADLCVVVAGLDDATARVAAPLVATTARARGITVLAILVPPRAGDADACRAVDAIVDTADHALMVRAPGGRGRRATVATGAALGEALTAILLPILVGGPGGAGVDTERGIAAMRTLIAESAGAPRPRGAATSARRSSRRIGAAYRTGQGPELSPLRVPPGR